MGIGSKFPSLIGSVSKHQQALSGDTLWPWINTSRAKCPSGLGAYHQATFTVGTTWLPTPWIPTQHHPGSLAMPSPQLRNIRFDPAPRPPPGPPTKAPSLPSSRSACSLTQFQFAPGMHFFSRPLPENVGSRNPRAPKSIPTNHQEIKEVSVQRGVSPCIAQDAVILGEISGKPEGR